jgi:hypothetical protein
MAHCPISMMVTFDQLFVGNGPIVFGRLLVMTHAFLRFGGTSRSWRQGWR